MFLNKYRKRKNLNGERIRKAAAVGNTLELVIPYGIITEFYFIGVRRLTVSMKYLITPETKEMGLARCPELRDIERTTLAVEPGRYTSSLIHYRKDEVLRDHQVIAMRIMMAASTMRKDKNNTNRIAGIFERI